VVLIKIGMEVTRKCKETCSLQDAKLREFQWLGLSSPWMQQLPRCKDGVYK